MKPITGLLLVIPVLLILGCGGGGNDGSEPTEPPEGPRIERTDEIEERTWVKRVPLNACNASGDMVWRGTLSNSTTLTVTVANGTVTTTGGSVELPGVGSVSITRALNKSYGQGWGNQVVQAVQIEVRTLPGHHEEHIINITESWSKGRLFVAGQEYEFWVLVGFDQFPGAPTVITCIQAQPSSDFTGLWLNVDPETRGITVVEVVEADSKLSVSVWGSCTPTDCDWGAESGVQVEDVVELTWDQGFVQRTMALTLPEPNLLEVTTDSVYQDERSPSHSIEMFERVTVPRPIPVLRAIDPDVLEGF